MSWLMAFDLPCILVSPTLKSLHQYLCLAFLMNSRASNHDGNGLATTSSGPGVNPATHKCNRMGSPSSLAIF